MKVTIKKMEHTTLLSNGKGKDIRVPCWALLDTDGHTIIQVYSTKEPLDIKEQLEKPIKK